MMQKFTANAYKWVIRHARRKKSILIILIVYLILAYVYYYFFLDWQQWQHTKKFFDKIEPGFAVSFSASILEDLMIFIALSFLIVALTTKDLFDYNFNEKIAAIINSENSDNSGLNNYLQKKVGSLLAYDKSVDFNLTVTEYNQEQNAYKLFIETFFNIKNMCRDTDFKLDEDYHFYIHKADTTIGSDCGEVTLFTTQRSTDRRPTVHVDETEVVKLDEKFNQPVDLSISKDKSLKVHIKFNTWSKTGNDFENDRFNTDYCVLVKSDRYVEKMTIVIKNKLRKAFKYEVFIKEKQKGNIKSLSLSDSGTRHPGNYDPLIIESGLFPEDRVLIYIHKL